MRLSGRYVFVLESIHHRLSWCDSALRNNSVQRKEITAASIIGLT
uniref:Uncharacterized protein n=1 Tax=Arundo donax TaxID=35708 RepID=A0A0A9IVU4_ARUDO